ncbi:putative ribonuclease H protein, partial [Trifolium medium]|nr:putative ribonuclease H protein [Trifolium medium]
MNVHDGVVAHQADSSLWKAIVKLWPKLQHMFWALGDGNNINVWREKWLDENSRICEMVEYRPEDMRELKIVDIIDEHGSWNYAMMQQHIPHNMLQKAGRDVMLWPGNNMSQFTLHSAYEKLAENDIDRVQLTDRAWTRIWRIPTVERVRVFAWIIKHDRLLTNAR